MQRVLISPPIASFAHELSPQLLAHGLGEVIVAVGAHDESALAAGHIRLVIRSQARVAVDHGQSVHRDALRDGPGARLLRPWSRIAAPVARNIDLFLVSENVVAVDQMPGVVDGMTDPGVVTEPCSAHLIDLVGESGDRIAVAENPPPRFLVIVRRAVPLDERHRNSRASLHDACNHFLVAKGFSHPCELQINSTSLMLSEPSIATTSSSDTGCAAAAGCRQSAAAMQAPA